MLFRSDLQTYERAFELLKRRYYAQMLRTFDDQDDYAISLLRAHFNGVEMMDSIEILKSIEFKDIISIGSHILVKPTALVKMTGLRNVAK